MNRGNPWLRYTRCEECGAPAKNACRTEDDDVADEPCPGRRLSGAGVVDVALAPYLPETKQTIPPTTTKPPKRAADVDVAPALHIKPAAAQSCCGGVNVEVLFDKFDRIRDAVAKQPDGLRAALAVIEQVRAILAPPQTVPDDTVSEAP